MIRIRVSEDCQHYGQCVMEAPDQFRLNQEGLLEYEAHADDSVLADVEGAADVCPMRAIAVERVDGA